MEFIKAGKTKDVYKLDNGNYLFRFKDTVTGLPTGESDPGGNLVIGSVEGVSTGALKMSAYYFELLKSKNIKTHYVDSDLAKKEMTVRNAIFFGKGLECVIRYFAVGSFIRRFGEYCREGDALPAVFEITLKDDGRDDPPITQEILSALNIMDSAVYESLRKNSVLISNIIKEDMEKKGLTLIDIKLEFAMVDGEIALIDEVSAGNMRVYKDGKKLSYLELMALY